MDWIKCPILPISLICVSIILYNTYTALSSLSNDIHNISEKADATYSKADSCLTKVDGILLDVQTATGNVNSTTDIVKGLISNLKKIIWRFTQVGEGDTLLTC